MRETIRSANLWNRLPGSGRSPKPGWGRLAPLNSGLRFDGRRRPSATRSCRRPARPLHLGLLGQFEGVIKVDPKWHERPDSGGSIRLISHAKGRVFLHKKLSFATAFWHLAVSESWHNYSREPITPTKHCQGWKP